MAQVITLPATIVQSSDNAFNIYRFDATAQSYDVSVSDYASTGQVLVYQILTDNCRTLQSMSVRFQAMADISPTQPLESIFEDIFIPGTAYLLAIHTTGMTAARPYTLTIGAVIPSKPDTMMGISHPVNLVRTFMPIVVTSNLTLPRTHGVTQNIVPLPQAIVAPPQSEPQAPKPPKHEPKKPKEHKVKESKPKKH